MARRYPRSIRHMTEREREEWERHFENQERHKDCENDPCHECALCAEEAAVSARKLVCPACKSVTLQTGNRSPVWCKCNPKAPVRKVDVVVDAIVAKVMRLTPLVSRRAK